MLDSHTVSTHPWRLNPLAALALVLAPELSFSFACWRSGKTGHGSKSFQKIRSIFPSMPIFSTQDNSKGLLYNRVVPHLSDLAVITINPSPEGPSALHIVNLGDLYLCSYEQGYNYLKQSRQVKNNPLFHNRSTFVFFVAEL